MLIAPAGYGKTTLAEQWTSGPGRMAVWYQCRRASADVAHLAIGLAEAASALLPGCDTRLRERLLSTRDPAVEVELLGQILAEDLAPWPSDAWLVIDDYHLLNGAPEAERLVHMLVEDSSIAVLITSRHRPTWSTGRVLLHGDVFVLGRESLAMSGTEASDVLDGQSRSLADALLELARGWPAAIGLAHITQTEIWPDGTAAEELYRYFADEIYRNLAQEIRDDLARLVVAPTLDRELAARLIGETRADDVLRVAVEAGILTVRGDRYDFHPLARAFIERRSAPRARSLEKRTVEICLSAYRERRDWDSAFELVDRRGSKMDLDAIIGDALTQLLETGRLATIQTWIDAASRSSGVSPQARVAAAELAARRGELSLAETLVQGALLQVKPRSSLACRALNLAGHIAHLDSRDEDGVERYTRAETAAPSSELLREARWGRCVTLSALEEDAALTLLAELVADVPADDAREQVRAADKQISIGIRFGQLPDLARARRTEQLLSIVGDPRVRCSFRSVLSGGLILAGYYADGLRVAEDLVRDAADARSFGLTYGHANRALALAGQKQFARAHAALDEGYQTARLSSDAYGLQNIYTTRMRLLLHERRVPEACLLEPPEISSALPGMRGEVLGCRGLALAAVGRTSDALAFADQASGSSRALEATVLAVAIRAVVDVRAGSDDALHSAERLLDEADARGAIDLFVIAYRAAPDILRLLLMNPRTKDRALFAVTRVGDREIAVATGTTLEDMFDPVATLSPRERDVYALLCEGLSDREIAKLLFIAPGTTKTHTHSILEKTGFKTRRALMLDAARRRQDHAAPTATLDQESSAGS